jgi:hypothetical protein
MFKPRTLKILAAIITGYLLLLLPAQIWPGYLDTPAGIILVFPYLSIYLFHGIGIPFLLQNNGACGWGWCAPTLFGWVFLGTFWILVVWLIAAGFAGQLQRNKDDVKAQP